MRVEVHNELFDLTVGFASCRSTAKRRRIRMEDRMSGPTYGDLVVCAHPDREWYGWVGIVRGKNQNNLGIAFEYDPGDPPPATGRWVAKRHVVALETLSSAAESVREAVERYRRWSNLFRKARESATLAVETYNRPTASFRTGAFGTLMILAWTSLLLAIRVRQGHSPYELDEESDQPVLINDAPKFLGIRDLIKWYLPAAERAKAKNLLLFVEIRNELEHADVPGLDEKVLGEAQSLLRNFESTLISEFGERFAINPSLAYTVTLSRAPLRQRQEHLRSATGGDVSRLLEHVDQFRNSLDRQILESQDFSFQVFLIPRIGNHRSSADLAVRWVDVDTDDPEAVASASEHVAALLRVRHVDVRNRGSLRASDVASKVSDELGVVFSASTHHPVACRSLGAWKSAARPRRPEDCDSRYALYDAPHRDVVYTDAWVRRLLQELRDPDRQASIFGRRLRPIRIE